MFLYWAMMLSVSGMYTMYITNIGFSKKEISIAVTIYTLSSLLGQSLIGYLVDKFGQARKILLSFLSVGILIGAVITFTETHWFIYLLLFLWGFCMYGTVPLSEAWCIGTLNSQREQINFGKVRGFGSIGYGLSGIAIGMLLERLGWGIYKWYIVIAVIFTLLTLYLMKDKEVDNSKEHNRIHRAKDDTSIREALSEILKIKPLIGIIAIIFIYTFVVKGIYNYLGVLVSDFGGGPLSLGLTYFFDAFPEIVTFLLASRLMRRFKSRNLIIIGFLLQIVRFIVILIFNNAMAVILMGVLSGFAYGLVATSYKTYIYELAPAKYKATCMSLAETIIGLSAITSAPIFGVMFTKFGINTTIAFGLGIYVFMVLILLKDKVNSK